MEILIDLYSDCGNSCVFCSKRYSGGIYGFEKIEEVKEKVLSSKDIEGDFYIGGQEPFNSSIIFETLKFIRKNSNKKIIIKTSGVINNINILSKEMLSYIDIIQIPCHSLNKKDFNDIYGNNLAFEKYNKFLDKISKSNMYGKLNFHTLVLKENYKDLGNILLYLHRKFFIKTLVIVYPIRPFNNINNYYNITVPRGLIKDMYKDFINESIFLLINLDKDIKKIEEKIEEKTNEAFNK